MAAWPGGLASKKFAVSGYSEEAHIDPAVRTNMDSGPPKARSRFTAVPIKLEGNLDSLTSSEVDTLMTFYKTTCSNGSVTVTGFPHPRTGNAVTLMWLKFPTITPAQGSPITFNASLSFLIVG